MNAMTRKTKARWNELNFIVSAFILKNVIFRSQSINETTLQNVVSFF